MSIESLELFEPIELRSPSLIIGLSGWMDGGDVSTGTVQVLIDSLPAVRLLGQIRPDPYYIYSFPGSMEVSAIFRPFVEIEEGLVESYVEPTNEFYVDTENDLLLFLGKEPHLHWDQYCDCVFEVVNRFGVGDMLFVGSVAGLVPHTREPRISGVVSTDELKEDFDELNIKETTYEGPASLFNHLMRRAIEADIAMRAMIVETPAYVHGRNPRCIEAVLKRILRLYGLELELAGLHALGEELEKKLDRIIEGRAELAEHIKVLEENYDREIFDTEMGDLKQWLQERGIRLN